MMSARLIPLVETLKWFRCNLEASTISQNKYIYNIVNTKVVYHYWCLIDLSICISLRTSTAISSDPDDWDAGELWRLMSLSARRVIQFSVTSTSFSSPIFAIRPQEYQTEAVTTEISCRVSLAVGICNHCAVIVAQRACNNKSMIFSQHRWLGQHSENWDQ